MLPKLLWRGLLISVSLTTIFLAIYVTHVYRKNAVHHTIPAIDDIALSINVGKPNNKFSGYGTGCRENPFRERLKTLLRTWEDIAVRRNITNYFLCYGSVLGQARDGDVVPYDHDVDVCMFRKDLGKLELEDEKRPFQYDDGKPHMMLQRHCSNSNDDTPRRDCNGHVVYKYVDVCAIVEPCARILLGSPPFLDVFAFSDNGDELLDELENTKHKRGVILPVKPCQFMGIETRCPGDTATYLRTYFGNNYLNSVHYLCKNGKWVATSKNVDPINVPHD